MKNVKVRFEPEKDTKNTVRFQEHLDGPLDTPAIGTLYVPKATLKVLDYKEGQALSLTLEIDQ